MLLGYIYSGKLNNLQEKLLEVLKTKFLEVVTVDISVEIHENDLLKLYKCNLVFNDSGEDRSVKLLSILGEMGVKTVESISGIIQENKWNTYEICKKNKIPAPQSILLSRNLETAKQQLIKFNNWPVVLKAVRGTWGEFVQKADNLDEAVQTIQKFCEKKQRKLSIIAQEFIDSFSYRVTYIDREIVQTAIKENNNWKCTGVYAKNFKTFEVDDELKGIVESIMDNFDLKICGIDFLKKEGQWYLIEVNSEPALDFFESEIPGLIEKMASLLYRLAKEEKSKSSVYVLNRVRKKDL